MGLCFANSQIPGNLVQLVYLGGVITGYFFCWWLTIHFSKLGSFRESVRFLIPLERTKHFALNAKSFEISDEITQSKPNKNCEM